MTRRQLNACQELVKAANGFALAFSDTDPDMMKELRKFTTAITEWMCESGEDGKHTPN